LSNRKKRLTIGAAFTSGTLTSGNKVYYSFSAAAGSYYTASWDDSFSGSGTYTADIYVKVLRANGTTTLKSSADSGYYPSTFDIFQASATETVYIEVSGFSTSSGTFGVRIGQSLTWAGLTSGTASDLYGIACPGSSTTTCVVVGGSGLVRRTTDGNTWSSMTSGTANTLFGISCPSSTICYAVGAAGTIIKSTDGGVNWTTQTSNTANALGGISCPSTTVCYAAGVNGTVDKTSDGSTWAVQTSNTTAQLNSLHCASTTLCVAVGNSGTIIRTGDGTTWSVQSSGTTSPLLGAFVADSSNHLVVGGNASASSHKGTSNGGSTWATQYLGTSAALSYLSCFID
jgi:hypothetical protein